MQNELGASVFGGNSILVSIIRAVAQDTSNHSPETVLV